MSTYTVRYLPKSVVEAKIVIDVETINDAYKKSLKVAASKTQLPGFRKGKAPEAMVEGYIGKEKIYEQTLNAVIPNEFEAALKEDQKRSKGRIVILKTPDYKIENEWKPGEELHLLATAVIYPRFDVSVLGEKLRVKKEKTEDVSESEVEEAIERIFQQYIKIKKADSEKNSGENSVTDEDQAEQVIDKDDLFAKAAGANDMADLKKNIRQELEYEKNSKAEREFEDSVLKKAQEMIEIDIPDLLVDEEVLRIQDRFQTQLSRIGTTIDKYLETEGKTKEALLEEWREKARENTKIALILQEVRISRELQVTDEEIKFVALQNGLNKGVTEEQYNTLSYIVGQSKALTEIKRIAAQE